MSDIVASMLLSRAVYQDLQLTVSRTTRTQIVCYVPKLQSFYFLYNP